MIDDRTEEVQDYIVQLRKFSRLSSARIAVEVEKRYGIRWAATTIQRKIRADPRCDGIESIPAKRTLVPCGTIGAYYRHRRNNEYPCEACLAVKKASAKDWRRQTIQREIRQTISMLTMLNRILDLHTPAGDSDECDQCHVPYPCPTIHLANEAIKENDVYQPD